MSEPLTPDTNLADLVPSPDTIRRRLAALLREREVLRGLLKVAERKQSNLPQRGNGELVEA